MRNTSLCYIFDGDRVLLLHKNVNHDLNYDKWLGVGGKFLEDESPFDCVVREAKEETGLTLLKPAYRGIVTFVSNEWESEQMHLFTSDAFVGELCDCTEGELAWVPEGEILYLPMWEGDRAFVEKLLAGEKEINLTLQYTGEKCTILKKP